MTDADRRMFRETGKAFVVALRDPKKRDEVCTLISFAGSRIAAEMSGPIHAVIAVADYGDAADLAALLEAHDVLDAIVDTLNRACEDSLGRYTRRFNAMTEGEVRRHVPGLR